jgi:hypothetical protein
VRSCHTQKKKERKKEGRKGNREGRERKVRREE